MFQSKAPTTKTAMTSQPPKRPVNQQNSIQKNVLVNFIAGGIGGTAGVFITCPLDVVQTRLQSSIASLNSNNSNRFGLNVFCYLKQIAQTEGIGALYKGLVPNLVGIAPSRAMYFSVYTTTKGYLSNTHLSNSSWTHMISALTASWSTSTVTNPIWFIKTRLQLDLTATGKRPPISEVVRDVFRNEGIRGFYRGLSASYMGASETMIYFVLYEKLKLFRTDMIHNNKDKLSAVDYICAAFIAKSLATVSVYPHEVARTRLRQESAKHVGQKKYRGFFQTLLTVYKEERLAGLYGGMGAHLMRQVPNTVIMFLTYETIVNFFSND